MANKQLIQNVFDKIKTHSKKRIDTSHFDIVFYTFILKWSPLESETLTDVAFQDLSGIEILYDNNDTPHYFEKIINLSTQPNRVLQELLLMLS